MMTVEIDNVTKRFGDVTAVNGLSMQVPAGSIFGFIGPNGSGKTTTLRLIMRIYYPDSGHIRVFGEQSKEAANDRIGYLPEERGLYKKMKVLELLQFFAALKGRNDGRSEAKRWLDALDLGEWGNKNVETLSKGMAQKVQFIAAVIAQPELVILDEPFSGLDPVNADVIRDAVIELRNAGTTVIFSTHDMEVAEKMCDRISMIFRSRKVIDGTLESIQDEYGSDVVRVRLENNGSQTADLTRLPEVEQVNDFGRLQELRLKEGADAQAVLAGLMSIGSVRHFELARPSLRDIFVRIAGPEAQGAIDE